MYLESARRNIPKSGFKLMLELGSSSVTPSLKAHFQDIDDNYGRLPYAKASKTDSSHYFEKAIVDMKKDCLITTCGIEVNTKELTEARAQK